MPRAKWDMGCRGLNGTWDAAGYRDQGCRGLQGPGMPRAIPTRVVQGTAQSPPWYTSWYTSWVHPVHTLLLVYLVMTYTTLSVPGRRPWALFVRPSLGEVSFDTQVSFSLL